jgi:hypothetical protein
MSRLSQLAQAARVEVLDSRLEALLRAQATGASSGSGDSAAAAAAAAAAVAPATTVRSPAAAATKTAAGTGKARGSSRSRQQQQSQRSATANPWRASSRSSGTAAAQQQAQSAADDTAVRSSQRVPCANGRERVRAATRSVHFQLHKREAASVSPERVTRRAPDTSTAANRSSSVGPCFCCSTPGCCGVAAAATVAAAGAAIAPRSIDSALAASVRASARQQPAHSAASISRGHTLLTADAAAQTDADDSSSTVTAAAVDAATVTAQVSYYTVPRLCLYVVVIIVRDESFSQLL